MLLIINYTNLQQSQSQLNLTEKRTGARDFLKHICRCIDLTTITLVSTISIHNSLPYSHRRQLTSRKQATDWRTPKPTPIYYLQFHPFKPHPLRKLIKKRPTENWTEKATHTVRYFADTSQFWETSRRRGESANTYIEIKQFFLCVISRTVSSCRMYTNKKRQRNFKR